MVPQWLSTAVIGRLSLGNTMTAAKIDPQKLHDAWNKAQITCCLVLKQ